MGATIVLEACFGQEAWIDARQQLALLLPFWAFLWLTVAMVDGVDAAIFPWVFAGSFILQTHFSYAYLGMVLVLLGAGGYLWTNRDRRRTRSFRVAIVAGCAWALILWIHPIWDQLFRTGNVSAVVRHSGGERSVGFLAGSDIVADSPFGFPFWWPGSLSRFEPPWSDSSWPSSLVVGLWLGLLVCPVAWSPCVAAFALLVSSRCSASPSHWLRGSRRVASRWTFPQNYFWLWPISLFVALSRVARQPARLLPTSVATCRNPHDRARRSGRVRRAELARFDDVGVGAGAGRLGCPDVARPTPSTSRRDT